MGAVACCDNSSKSEAEFSDVNAAPGSGRVETVQSVPALAEPRGTALMIPEVGLEAQGEIDLGERSYQQMPVGDQFEVTLMKQQKDQKFGFVNASRRDSKPVLVVTRISDGGLLEEWNSKAPLATQVGVNAEISSVNSIVGDTAKMRTELQKSQTVVLTVQNMRVVVP
mmetsp:Transcript_89721/g.240698  ORF Transcript_89721/g.240698 Transcript_89721/m.240698 type:complete len:168 (+) Transcript_89721:49-552(+)